MSDSVRLTLIAISAVFGAVAVSYRIRSLSGESIDRTKEGWPILIGLRLAGLLAVGSTVAWFFNPAWFGPVALTTPENARWVGVAGFACAACWLLWMFHTLGRNLTDSVVTRQNATFVDHGPYRIVRNPMYTGTLMAGISIGLAMGIWLVPLLTVVVFTFFVLRTKIEEKYLIARFGDTYRQYMARVGRFFPKLSPGK